MSRFAVCVNAALLCFLQVRHAVAFSPISGVAQCGQRNKAAFFRPVAGPPSAVLALKRLHAKENQGQDDEDLEDDTRQGMAAAFRDLDALSSEDIPSNAPTLSEADTSAFSQSLKELESMDLDKEDASPSTEEEIKLYQEMYSELEGGEESMYDSIKGELGSSESSALEDAMAKAEEDALDDVDGIGTTTDETPEGMTPESIDMDSFMNRALEEAIDEANKLSPEELQSTAENILDEKELKKEIAAVFEEANEKLLAGIEDIRKQQEAFAKERADERAKAAPEDLTQDKKERLAEAEAAASRLVETVSRETAEMEKAIADMKSAQEELKADPLSGLADLKGSGIAKQASLVGALLFSIRAALDAVQMGGIDGEAHATAAAVQAVIALACGGYFFLS